MAFCHVYDKRLVMAFGHKIKGGSMLQLRAGSRLVPYRGTRAEASKRLTGWLYAMSGTIAPAGSEIAASDVFTFCSIV